MKPTAEIRRDLDIPTEVSGLKKDYNFLNRGNMDLWFLDGDDTHDFPRNSLFFL